MSDEDNTERTTTTTIPGGTGRLVIEHREPKRRRAMGVFLFLSVFLNMILFAGKGAVGLNRLEERYVAGATLPTKAKIAIVDVHGTIDESSTDHILKQVRQARDDSSVVGVILRVNSPGGTVTGSDQIWREIATLKAADKPVVASFGGIAASGGYYVSAAADMIFAEPTTLTGSIGVKMEIPQIEEFLKKVGVEFESITTGKWKNSGSMYHAMNEEEKARWKSLLNHSHARFVRVVAQGRKLAIEAAESVADGKVLTTDEAVAAKLVDRVGYLDDAISYLQTKLGLETPRVVRYAKPVSFSDVLFPELGKAQAVEERLFDKLKTPQLMYSAY